MRKAVIALVLCGVAFSAWAAVPCQFTDPGPGFVATPSPSGGVDLRVRFFVATSGGGVSAPVVTTPPGEIRVEQNATAGILPAGACWVETVHVDVPAGTYSVTWRINNVDIDGNPLGPPTVITGVAQSNHPNPSVPTVDWRGLAMLAAGTIVVALFLLRR